MNVDMSMTNENDRYNRIRNPNGPKLSASTFSCYSTPCSTLVLLGQICVIHVTCMSIPVPPKNGLEPLNYIMLD
jgi:hypothetical protein